MPVTVVSPWSPKAGAEHRWLVRLVAGYRVAGDGLVRLVPEPPGRTLVVWLTDGDGYAGQWLARQDQDAATRVLDARRDGVPVDQAGVELLDAAELAGFAGQLICLQSSDSPLSV